MFSIIVQGDLQLLMISPTPDAAYEMCNEYCPPCDQSFKYSQLKANNVSGTTVTATNSLSTPKVLSKPDKGNSTSSKDGKSKDSKHGKKKKKKLQALESQYTSVDVGPDFDDDDYDDEDESDNDENPNRGNSDMTIVSITRQPTYENNVRTNVPW